MVLVVNIEGAQKLSVRYLDHKAKMSRTSVPIKAIFPGRCNATSIDEV